MARLPVVSRTITTFKTTVICLDVSQDKPFERTIYLSGRLKNTEIKQAAEKKLNTENVKVAYIKAVEPETKLYAMTEQEFIDTATVYPPRPTPTTKKENEK